MSQGRDVKHRIAVIKSAHCVVAQVLKLELTSYALCTFMSGC